MNYIYLSKAALTTAAFLILTAAAWAGPKEDSDRFFWGRVVQVQDGDTITVVRNNEDLDLIVIRLYNIDAPEGDQPYGKQAANKLRRLINKNIIQVEIMQKSDRYGRIVGIVKQDGKDVGRVMAESGLAWVEPRYCKRKKLCNGYWAAARRAQNGQDGLWKSKKAEPPWEWRKIDFSS